MKRLLILGAGTSGTMMANHLKHELDQEEWELVIIDECDTHYYQPGYLFLPFDLYLSNCLNRSLDQPFNQSVIHSFNQSF